MRPRYAILLARSDLGTHALPPRSRHCRGCDENRSVLTCSNAGPYILPPNCDARNSFRIRFYEDCRVSPALRPSHQLPRLLYFHTLTNCKFSNSFALIFMQNAWGAPSEWLCSSKPQPLRSYRPIASPIPFLFTSLRTLLCFFASRQNSTHLFSIASALFAKNTRGGGGVNQISDEEICPEEHRDEGHLLQAADYYPAGPEPRRAEHRDERTSV
jgi:hypothetical protein